MLISHFKRGKDKKKRKKPIGRQGARIIHGSLGVLGGLSALHLADRAIQRSKNRKLNLALAAASGYMAHRDINRAIKPKRRDIEEAGYLLNPYK